MPYKDPERRRAAARAYRKAKRAGLERGGGCLPTLRTAYSLRQRRALAALAESNPTPETYARERARILASP